ncbi:MAG TPA: CpsD/CapB family tyrosine-protein kinase [Thermoanaerobaculia bacterium]|nr:CpsD/CapB family tyrosine-protein kinase [Thermoanaerobaculia bacterium]
MDLSLRTERSPRAPRELGPSRRIQLRDDAPVINHMDPPSFAAEQYRSLAVQVEEQINPLGNLGYVLTVTSPEEGAGKTLTSLNLALTLTRGQERRVLLLEGDLWRPQLHTYFLPERPDRPGLQQVLERRTQLAEAVVSLEGSTLDVLLAGASGGGDVMSSRRMSEVLAEVRAAYEMVVIDSPPMGLLASARSLAARSDGVVVVVRAGQTKKGSLEKTLAALGPDKLVGAVLNCARISDRGYRGYY